MNNFFEQQDQARKISYYLIFLFACAIAGTTFALYIALILADIKVTGNAVALWAPEYVIVATVIVGFTVGLGSLSKTQSLRGGGAVVAASLGGQAVSLESTDPQHQELLNVVSEMAIAAGTAVPSVYILPDRGINAFAAGLTPNNAVIGVTQGTLDQLTRDQLQGVIAHEFSHIVNGDMALNLKLIGLLHGLLLLHIAGRHILFPGRTARRSSRNRDGLSPIQAVGIGLLIGGGVGWLFGLLIKSAVSRQREYLADAAAVQFTRNADGITDALRRIATTSANSARIDSPNAEAASHLFFNQLPGLGAAISLFATHPPLESRIRRLSGGRRLPPLERHDETNAIGAANAVQRTSKNSAQSLLPVDSAARTALPLAAAASLTPNSKTNPTIQSSIASPAAVTAQIGTATPEHLRHAKALLSQLPDVLHKAARSQTGAVAIVYSLLLDQKTDVTTRQKQLIAAHSPTVLTAMEKIGPAMSSVSVRSRLPLVELCIPALKTLKPAVAAQFFQRIKDLVRASGTLSLSEYAIQSVLQYRLEEHFRTGPAPTTNITALAEVWSECQGLLSALARVGHQRPSDADYAFRNGLSQLSTKGCAPASSTLPQASLPQLSNALKRLRLTKPALKQSIADACAHTVLTDGQTTDQEAELLRAILISLGCPLPPFIDAVSPTKSASVGPSSRVA
ncbi:MAG: M48 family metallopeptidase [Cyanobacteria bacterium J06631_9]